MPSAYLGLLDLRTAAPTHTAVHRAVGSSLLASRHSSHCRCWLALTRVVAVVAAAVCISVSPHTGVHRAGVPTLVLLRWCHVFVNER